MPALEMLFGIYSKLIAAALVAVFIAGVYWRGHTQGAKAVKLEWAADVQARTAAALQAEQAARAVEVELQSKADSIRRAKNAEIQSLSVRVGEYAARLSNRPDRPAAGDVPETTGPGGSATGCTGAGLFKRDSEFLTGLAADADRLRIGLEACQQAYRAARAVK